MVLLPISCSDDPPPCHPEGDPDGTIYGPTPMPLPGPGGPGEPPDHRDAPEKYSKNEDGEVCRCSPYQYGCTTDPDGVAGDESGSWHPPSASSDDGQDGAAPRKRCENAVHEGADIWQLMCGALVAPPDVVQQCRAEHSQGRAAGIAACKSGPCATGCQALDTRWALYCRERIPGELQNVCNQAREHGNKKCLEVCR
jgi:hypothetical protein